MKIAVITAVFGGMDTEKPFCKQSVDCDRIFINEQNSPFPLPNLPPLCYPCCSWPLSLRPAAGSSSLPAAWGAFRPRK